MSNNSTAFPDRTITFGDYCQNKDWISVHPAHCDDRAHDATEAAYVVPWETVSVNHTVEMAYAQADRLLCLGPNWDGYQAPRIDPLIIAAAKAFCKQMGNEIPSGLHMAPLASGSIQLEWHRGDRSLEFEFEGPNTIHYLKWDPSFSIEEESDFEAVQFYTAKELFDWFKSEGA